ncbi:class II aaRS and biotin synthetase [Daedalea quercina L-15889]|uniref:Class II aaRS and biotin synthetase n=1 Tax=Daedalea quercina L-15889 TaxID=1314783 RepID=A0A165L9Y6_9APHY|nr:class II aaRS and biotin synthetase [Daedalea quercina L-15889]
MNVLVYSGPEVLAPSVSHCITSLRILLVPNYAVQTVSRQSLASRAWLGSCALLVLPACKTAPADSGLGSMIEQYVHDGGKLLTIGANVKLQTRGVSSATGLQGRLSRMTLTESSAPLLFSDKISGSKVSVNFEGRSLENTQLAVVSSSNIRVGCMPLLGNFQGVSNTACGTMESIAHVVEDDSNASVAVVKLSHGNGSVVFSAVLADHPITEEPLLSRLASPPFSMSGTQLQAAEAERQQLFASILQALGLTLPEKTSTSLSPLPQFLTGNPSKPWIVDNALRALSIEPETLSNDKPVVSQDSNDTFQYHLASPDWKLLDQSRDEARRRMDPSSWNPKDVLVCRGGLLPSTRETPLFDVEKFYTELAVARRKGDRKDKEGSWGVGEALIYGEVVTSTQTMLDKNTHLLSSLPVPLVSIASHQLSGRGRGSNIWLSPSGCLQFSLLLRVSLSELPSSKLVFVQYLFGLAVVEACRDEAVLGEEGSRVRLKWPNDIYAMTSGGEKKKIGGILINTSFSSGKVEIVIGSGLNVFNPPPIQSLLQFVPSQTNLTLTMERTATIILTKFEELWETFLRHKGSFEPFLDLYYDRWLHSDQLVELTTVIPPQMVRIVGITGDHGLLRTMPERDGWTGNSGETYIDLQPDGNSFDLMAGLIKAKT